MGQEERRYVRAIIDDPMDDDRRLCYASWLDSRGAGDQAEFARVQVAIKRAFPEQPDASLRAREQMFMAAANASVRDLARAANAVVEYQGGLPDLVRVGRRTRLGPDLEALFGELPLSALVVRRDDLGAVLDAARHSPGRLISLGWFGRRQGGGPGTVARGLIRVADDPQLAGVRVLNLWGVRIGDAPARVLGRAPFLGSVRFLMAVRCGLTAGGLRAILRGCGPHLRYLEVSGNPLGDAGVDVLADAAPRLGIRYLGLARTGLGSAGGRSLVASHRFDGLQCAVLRGNRLGAARRHLRARYGHRYVG